MILKSFFIDIRPNQSLNFFFVPVMTGFFPSNVKTQGGGKKMKGAVKNPGDRSQCNSLVGYRVVIIIFSRVGKEHTITNWVPLWTGWRLLTLHSTITWLTLTRSLDGCDGQIKTLTLYSDPNTNQNPNPIQGSILTLRHVGWFGISVQKYFDLI